MNVKQAVGSIGFFLLAGLGMFALLRSHGDSPSPPESESISTVVAVQTNALKLATLRRYINAYGTVELAPAAGNAPSADALVSAPVAGVITKVAVVQGQRVEKGALLAELNSGTTTLEYATQQLERQKMLYAQQNTSLKNLQDAELQLAFLRVSSPMAGTVTHVNVTPGQAVDLTTVVAEVMDLSRLTVNAEIPATEAGGLKSGDPIELLTDPPVVTEVSFVSPEVDRSNSTVLVRALLASDAGFRPGQFLQLRIVTAAHTNCLTAPVESVVTDDDGNSAVAVVKGDEASRTPVQTGFREQGWVEIIAPELKAGDTVVTVGAYGLPAKTRILVENTASGDSPSADSKAR